jgi:ferredoxin-NADP reductase
VVAASLSGHFTLPKNQGQKLIVIAGGIGITPFRSMLKYLVDRNEKRDIVLFYANKSADEIAYLDVFSEAQKKLGVKVVYTLTDQVPPNWSGRTGRIDANMIKLEVPDYLDRYFYLSGSHAMVVAYEQVLKELGIKKNQIIKDYFPGLT